MRGEGTTEPEKVMQLTDLYKPLDQMTDEELKERLQQIRHNRTVARPAAKAREKKASSKGSVTRVNKLHAMMAAMSPEDKAQLLLDLGMSNDQS